MTHAGAMVALMPTGADAARLAVDGGEPVGELHVTLRYLGKGADFSEQARQQLIGLVREYVAGLTVFTADAFNVAIFNPAGDEPCITLGLGGGDIVRAHARVAAALDDFGGKLPEPHKPFVPHMTLLYTGDASRVEELLGRVGPVAFDRVRVAFAGEGVDIPLASSGAGREAPLVLFASVADELATLFERHLPGLHDQKDHGKWAAAKKAAKGAAAAPKAPKAPRQPKPKAATGPAPKRPRTSKAAPRPDAAAVAALRRSWDSGVKDNETLAGGIRAATDLVKFNDGSKAVSKFYGRGDGSRREVDSEKLAADMALVVGMSAPAVWRQDETSVLMTYVDGAKTGYEVDESTIPGHVRSDAGLRMGLLDLLMENRDRHEGNWMVTRSGELVAIDHGSGWEAPEMVFDGGKKEKRPSLIVEAASQAPGLSEFTDAFVERDGGTRYIDNPLTPADVAHVRKGLEALRPQFDELGRGEWLDFSLARLDVIGQHAKGTRNVVAP